MKKFILCYLFFILCIHNIYSQSSCATAFLDGNMDSIPMPFPAVGTVAPAGPDYGTLDILTRPIWGYVASCDSNVIIELAYDVAQLNPSAYCSLIAWGPFYSKNDACNNLTAGNIKFVRDSFLHNFVNYNFWNIFADEGEIYVYMLTTDDMTPANNYISHTWYSIQLMGGSDRPCYVCNDKVTQMFRRYACMITFDNTSQHTKLVWEKEFNNGVGGYIIYRSAGLGWPMDSVGFVPESVPSEFIDYSSHALQYVEYYKIVPVDSCGNRYSLYDYSYSISGFMQTNSNGNNVVNLNYTIAGVSNAYNTFESVLYIHRGSSAQNMQIIDTIPVSVTNYTDNTAPPGQQYYAVEHRRLSPCDPLRLASSGSPYTSSMTNTSVATVTGLPVINDENLIEVSPVPVIDILNVSVNTTLIGSKLTLVDVSGKVQQSALIQNATETIDVSDLAAGTYWICITGKNKIVKKIIVGK